ncbi:MAG TPA: HEAT repeat domain-containing protein [Fimbriiglobus sp.]|nr:HEAT repeat domain-containing protein [Fimbriiglobus sp.]
MTRWAWATTVAVGLACAGIAAGQAPPTRVSVAPPAPSSPPGATDGPRAGDVIALRTAGQPERKVKVLRLTRPDGGELLADLQDLATGARYTVPARMLTAKPRPAPPTSAGTGLYHNPTRWNTAPRPPVAQPRPASPVTTQKFIAYKPPAPSRVVLTQERPAPLPPPAAKPKPSPPPVAPPPVVIARPPVTPLPYERPLPPPVAPPPFAALRPATEFAPASAPEVRPAGLFDPLPLHLVPPAPVAAADPMAEETGPYLRDLFDALRPSVRERAATALAECRYNSQPEVKAQLAKAAAADPCPDVRAHCVRLLSKLGYHESRYLDELAGWAESGPPALRQAARDALARLAVKN